MKLVLFIRRSLICGLNGRKEDSTQVQSISPRINVNATRDLGNGFTADARADGMVSYRRSITLL